MLLLYVVTGLALACVPSWRDVTFSLNVSDMLSGLSGGESRSPAGADISTINCPSAVIVFAIYAKHRLEWRWKRFFILLLQDGLKRRQLPLCVCAQVGSFRCLCPYGKLPATLHHLC